MTGMPKTGCSMPSTRPTSPGNASKPALRNRCSPTSPMPRRRWAPRAKARSTSTSRSNRDSTWLIPKNRSLSCGTASTNLSRRPRASPAGSFKMASRCRGKTRSKSGEISFPTFEAETRSSSTSQARNTSTRSEPPSRMQKNASSSPAGR
ncbi:hypothetical protein D3C86_1251590 [compost metagenome]